MACFGVYGGNFDGSIHNLSAAVGGFCLLAHALAL
jgi:hypothetical protein